MVLFVTSCLNLAKITIMMSMIPLRNFRYQSDKTIPFEIARIEEKPAMARAGYPKRNNFYQVYWLDCGTGTYYIDFIGHKIRQDTLYFVAPYQVNYWKIDEDISGYVMLFTEELFHTKGLEYFLPKLDLFQVIGGISAISLGNDNAKTVDSIVHLIAEEYAQAEQGYGEAIVGLLQFLLVWSQRFAVDAWQSQPKTARDQLTLQFLNLLELHFRAEHNPQWYAQELGVTAGYLTKTVREMMGVTAGALLRQRLIIEAKRWLAHSEWTVAQIAEYLHFADASYFGRFFRRETAVTPRTFRQEFHTTWQDGQV